MNSSNQNTGVSLYLRVIEAATKKDKAALTEILAENLISLNILDHTNQNPLTYLAAQGKQDIIDFLIYYFNPSLASASIVLGFAQCLEDKSKEIDDILTSEPNLEEKFNLYPKIVEGYCRAGNIAQANKYYRAAQEFLVANTNIENVPDKEFNLNSSKLAGLSYIYSQTIKNNAASKSDPKKLWQLILNIINAETDASNKLQLQKIFVFEMALAGRSQESENFKKVKKGHLAELIKKQIIGYTQGGNTEIFNKMYEKVAKDKKSKTRAIGAYGYAITNHVNATKMLPAKKKAELTETDREERTTYLTALVQGYKAGGYFAKALAVIELAKDAVERKIILIILLTKLAIPLLEASKDSLEVLALLKKIFLLPENLAEEKVLLESLFKDKPQIHEKFLPYNNQLKEMEKSYPLINVNKNDHSLFLKLKLEAYVRSGLIDWAINLYESEPIDLMGIMMNELSKINHEYMWKVLQSTTSIANFATALISIDKKFYEGVWFSTKENALRTFTTIPFYLRATIAGELIVKNVNAAVNYDPMNLLLRAEKIRQIIKSNIASDYEYKQALLLITLDLEIKVILCQLDFQDAMSKESVRNNASIILKIASFLAPSQIQNDKKSLDLANRFIVHIYGQHDFFSRNKSLQSPRLEEKTILQQELSGPASP